MGQNNTVAERGAAVTTAPYSLEAEESLIGSVMIDGEAFRSLSSLVAAEDFFILRNGYMWEAFARLDRDGSPIDFVTVCETLRQMNRMTDVGGAAYLLHLANVTPTSVHGHVYAQLVARTAERRRLLRLADEIRALALDEDLSIDRVRAGTVDRMNAAQLGRSEFHLVPMLDAVGGYWNLIEALNDLPPGVISGVPTGFESVDAATDGFVEGSLNIIGARPKIGKSSLLTRIALAVAKAIAAGNLPQSPGTWVYLWTGEMPIRQLIGRMMAAELRLENKALRRGLRPGGLDKLDWGRFVGMAGDVGTLPILFDETRAITVAEMRLHIAEGARRFGRPALLMGDYLGLMRGDDADRRQNREREISGISEGLKIMALDYAPFVCAAQLNRDVERREDKRPTPSDLRDSGGIEQNADVVTFLYRDWVYNPGMADRNEAEWIWSYNRHGAQGTFPLRFESAYTRFEDVPPKVNFSQLNMPLVR